MRLIAMQQAGEEVVSVLLTTGERAGARMLVAATGAIEGTLGDVQLDADALVCARAVLASREPIYDKGLFAELHTPVEQLFVFGAGHIAIPLAELGARLGFQVTVLDDRAEFASAERFVHGVDVRLVDLAAPLRGLSIGVLSYIVLVTRAHEHDYDLLRVLLQSDVSPRYIGMIGSRRRVRAAFTALLADGIAREKLERIHAPIGLDIGAETPAEIAVSIAAELVSVRRGGSADQLKNEERVLERFF